MGNTSRGLLRPVMTMWLWSLRWRMRNVPRPADATHADARGDGSDWVLIVGNDIARGWGVRSHDLGLPGHLAREMSRSTGRGTDVDVMMAKDADAIARIGIDTADSHYDTVVVVTGAAEAIALRSPEHWRASVTRMLDALVPTRDARVHVVFVAIRSFEFSGLINAKLGSVASEHARELNAITKELCATVPQASFVELPGTASLSRPTEDRAALRFRLDAAALAMHLLPFAGVKGTVTSDSEKTGASVVPQNDAEIARQSAVDALPVLEGDLAKEVDGLVAAANAVYSTTFASFSVVDGEQLHYKVVAGAKPRSVPRGESICSIAMNTDGPTIVSDISRDARFRHVKGMRFYAGFPVLSESGHKVGMLCVVDTEPRDASSFDTTMLRELAQLLQKRLWSATSDADSLAK